MSMKMLTKELLAKLPPLYSQENEPDPKVVVKFFCPWGRFTWYALEYKPEEKFFFGYVRGLGEDCDELGYFSLDELESLRGPGGLKIERDRHWDSNTRLSQVKSGAKR